MLRIIGDGEHARVVRDAARREHFCVPCRITAIGDPAARARAVEEDGGFEPWIRLIHPQAVVSECVDYGRGVFVGPGAVINRGVTVNEHTIVNSGAIVEHDVWLGSFVNVGPGVAIGGGARIHNRTVLGLGCRIRDHVTVGSDVTVGMGAVVVSDVPDGVTVMGCPARIVEAKGAA